MNIQIDKELFRSLCLYFLSDEDCSDLVEPIQRALNDKLDKIIARELFSRYKRASTPFEREKFRKEYLDFIGINRNFRTDEEIRLDPQ